MSPGHSIEWVKLGRRKAHAIQFFGGAKPVRCQAMTYRGPCEAKGLAAFVLRDRIIPVCWLHAARGERRRELELEDAGGSR